MLDGRLEPGDVIADKYRVKHVLGHGGMGTVYSVEHCLTGKRLALKCLLPTYVSNPSLVERFIREAKAVGRIQHRHVIDVFDQGRDGDVLYIVLPLLEGMTLSGLFRDERLTLEDALVVLLRAMEGVAAAHAIGVLHRDLKPGNIFVCVGISGRLDDPRVLDFGISKLEDEVGSPLTRSGVAVGTPHYMPIEQLTGQRDLDARVDVYAMGVILYEAMSGVVPHTAENVAALAIRLLHTPPIHLSVRRPDLPPGLARVVMRALARDRDERYPSMRALIDAIAPFVRSSAGLTVVEPEGIPLRTPTETPHPSLLQLPDPSAPTRPAGQTLAAAALPSAPPAMAQGSLAPWRPGARWRALRVASVLGLLGLSAGLTKVLTGQSAAGANRPSTTLSGSPFVDHDAGVTEARLLGAVYDGTPQAPEPLGPSTALAPTDAGTDTRADAASAVRTRRLSKLRNKPTDSRPRAVVASSTEQPVPSVDAGATPRLTDTPSKADPRADSLDPNEF